MGRRSSSHRSRAAGGCGGGNCDVERGASQAQVILDLGNLFLIPAGGRDTRASGILPLAKNILPSNAYLAIRSPFTVRFRPLPSALRRPHSLIRSPFVDGSPSPLTGWKAFPAPPSIVHSAVCRPHSFIRSPFVDGLPLPDSLESLPYALCHLRSVVCIRLFVPHSLTVPLPSDRLESLSYAVRGPRSAVFFINFMTKIIPS
jgi:hypothetical protein